MKSLNNNPIDDFPNYEADYVASRFKDYVYVATASAIIRAQYVERVLNGICLMLGTQGLRFSQEDFLSGDASRLKQTLGMIEHQLRKTNLFDRAFSERLQEFVQRRNRIVHGLWADTFHSKDEIDISSPIAQKYVQECEWLSQEGPQLVEIGFGICRVLQEWVTPENPDYDEIVALRSSFDEYFDLGLGTIAAELKNGMGR